MATLEFRPPQFSEESAWAPCWLQQIKANPFEEYRIESETREATKEPFDAGVEEQRDPNLLTSEVRFNSFHLFLSEQESLHNSYTSPSANVLHLHLHLSSDGNSQCRPSELLNESQNLAESNDVISESRLQAQTTENVIPQTPINVKANFSHCEDKHKVRYPKVDDIKDAVELSVAASEALVIHELVKSGSVIKALPAETLLEVSLQVKKARWEMSKDFVHTQTEEAYQSDSLSDLDDFMMADAFDDVGLHLDGVKDQYATEIIMFQAPDTSVSEYHSGGGNQMGSVDVRIQETKSEIYSRHHQLEETLNADIQLTNGLLLESANYGEPYQISANHVLAPIRCDISEYGNYMFSQFAPKKSDVVAIPQNSEVQNHTFGSSSQHNCKSIAVEIQQTVVDLSMERFKSRWLGGWTGKKLDVTEKVKQCKRKTIPKPFFVETSFISESTDHDPDEHSFVKKSETQDKMAFQSSPPFDRLDDKIDNGMLLSQDVVRSSLSLADPLCSFVPCSISSENLCSTQAKNLNERANDTRHCFKNFPEFKGDNLNSTLAFKVEIHHQHENKSSIVDCEDTRPSIRREITSLKSYSVCFPNHASLCQSRGFHDHKTNQLQSNLGLLSTDRDAWTRFPCQTFLNESHLQSLSKSVGCFDTMENRETTVKLNQGGEKTKQKMMNTTTTVERQNFLVEPSLFLRHRTCSQLCLHEGFRTTFAAEKDPGPKSVDKVHHIKNFQKTPSNGDTSQETCLLNRKRVRFLESEVQVQEDKDLDKVHSSNKNRPDKKANTKIKYYNQGVNPRVHDCNSCLIKCCGRIEKRLIFHGINFLVTGYSGQKAKDMEELIRKYGGMTLLDIPPPNASRKNSKNSGHQLPVILSSKKLRSIKFLYGCAVNAFILHVDWLTDSIAACSLLPPGKYMIIPNQADWTQIRKRQSHSNRKYIFERVGIMLDGKHSFCTKLTKVFKHGGGHVFKNLQLLVKSISYGKLSVGAIVAQDTGRVSRHLKQCALEQGISLLPANWIVKSLHLGKLLPVAQENHFTSFPTTKILNVPIDAEMSQQA